MRLIAILTLVIGAGVLTPAAPQTPPSSSTAVRGDDRGALRARRVLRHRQPDLERALVPARAARSRGPQGDRRRVHRRRARSELLLHRARSGRRSRSWSTSGGTTCCCTCCSRRCSRCRGRASTISRCSRAGRRRRSPRRLGGAADRRARRLHRRRAGAEPRRRSRPGAGGMHDAIAAFGVPLSDGDRATIDRFHRRFIDDGLVAAVQQHRARAADWTIRRYAICCSSATRRRARELPRRRRRLPVPEGAAGARSGHPGRRRPQRADGARRDREAPRAAERAAVGLLRVERRVLPLSRRRFGRFVANLDRIPRAPQRGDHPQRLRRRRAGLPSGYLSSSILHPVQHLVDGYARGQFRQYQELTVAR